jgi:Secretion system C-terminal sorting domain
MKNVNKKFGFVVLLVVAVTSSAVAQNYTTVSDGNWVSAPRWNNTSGWGTSTPPIDGSQGSGTITMNNNMSINTNYNTGSAVLNIASGKTLTVSGNMTVGGGSTVNVSGNLNITGDLILNSVINILPGGTVTVDGSTYVNSSNNLIIGTNVAPPAYANLIIKTDLRQQGSGDVTVNRNGRVAVFGNISDAGGGGTFLRLNQGAQMYVNGNINYTGGGNDIINNNSTNPYGLYVNGTTSNTGGAANTTSNKGNKTTMQTTNATFYSWVASIPGNPLPVTLVFFKVGEVNEAGIELMWATASEKNFDYFVVETSNDGMEFNEIARVQGHGTTDVRHDYNYVVSNPVVGKSYFRLTSVDFDGYTEVFNVVSTVYETAKSMSVFPNPVVDSKVNINFNFVPSNDVTVSISDLTGMEVVRLQINGTENLLNLTLEPGTYLVKVSSAEYSGVNRVVVK